MKNFATFLKHREEASTEFVNGNVEPLLEVSTKVDPATIFPPPGNIVTGADNVNDHNIRGAKMFESFEENRFEIIHSAASEDLAYWVGIQHSKIKLHNQPKPVQMDLRVTEIFRNDNGDWKLIHRHADELKINHK